MSVDHSTTTAGSDALFLHVKAGISIVVTEGDQWWIGDVIFAEAAPVIRRFRPCFRWRMSTRG